MTFVTTDIDECKKGNICQENQNCFNEVGSYHCSCIDGYHMASGECVPNSQSGQPTIYLAVGGYIYRMSISYD